ncbi:hypothetical protein [Flavisolibacter nicotianae]|uniref:hypothetical protein n=1 Tax=Flavisolibacter nicotianae TaxID=2364882 RepID=UPI000EB2FBCD|nr:hypothetical protein [Flavisolibacter nicotianae]
MLIDERERVAGRLRPVANYRGSATEVGNGSFNQMLGRPVPGYWKKMPNYARFFDLGKAVIQN